LHGLNSKLMMIRSNHDEQERQFWIQRLNPRDVIVMLKEIRSNLNEVIPILEEQPNILDVIELDVIDADLENISEETNHEGNPTHNPSSVSSPT